MRRLLPDWLLLLLFGCTRHGSEQRLEDSPRAKERLRMVGEQIEDRGVDDPRVLEAMRRVPRHEFIPAHSQYEAYENHPVKIGAGQTISQPFIVAKMTELAELEEGERVLEIGTGSGYQAAVLAEIGCEVYSIEIVESLARAADEQLKRLGYKVEVRHGDGWQGWPEMAPFAAILVTAAPEEVPPRLVEQLAEGGCLVVPVGAQEDTQVLRRLRKRGGVLIDEEVFPVRFVPMTGEAQR